MGTSVLLAILVVLVSAAAASPAQRPAGSDSPVMGRGRGGIPFALNDKDKDGGRQQAQPGEPQK